MSRKKSNRKMISKKIWLIIGSLFAICCIQTFGEGISDPGAGEAVYYQQFIGKSDIGGKHVGSDGTATYSYPMGSVSLEYNSNSGWSVSGYSAISRSGRKGVPRYTVDDLFELDGQELVYVGGSNPREYRTKRESWQKIYYHNPDTNSSYWIVKHSDGSRAEYGSNINSRIEAVGGKNPGKIRAWAVQVEYSRGDYHRTDYYYEKDIDGSFYLVQKGLGKSSTIPCIQYDLFYTTSAHPRLNCRSGSFVLSNKILERVDVYRNDAFLNKYVIESGYGDAGEWQVKKITPYGEDGSSALPATTFDYHEFAPLFEAEPERWNVENYPGTNWGKDQCLREKDYADFMDVNGDGLVDRVIASSRGFVVWLNQQNGFRSPEIWMSFNGVNIPIRQKIFEAFDNWVQTETVGEFMDINGDTIPEIVEQVIPTGSDYKYNVHYKGMDTLGTLTIPTIDPDLRFLRFSGESPNGFYNYSDLFDINGDGRIDVVRSPDEYEPYIRIYVNNGQDIFTNTYEDIPINVDSYKFCLKEGIFGGEVIIEFIDMNGDGLPDRNEKLDGLNKLKTWFNTGYSFTDFEEWPNTDYDLRTLKDEFVDYMDINGDGLVDRLFQDGDYGNSLHVWLNTGYKQFDGSNMKIYNYTDSWCLREKGTGLEAGAVLADYLDMNGDGLLDRVYKSGEEENKQLLIWFNKGGPGGKLKRVVNSVGGTVEYNYNPLNKLDNPNCKPAMWVVTSEKVGDGKGNTYETTYQYSDGVYDPLEREFRGFGRVLTIEPTGNFTDSYYHTDPDKKGLPDAVHYFTQRNKQTGWEKYEYGAPVLTVPGNDKVKFIPLVKEHQYTIDCTDERREVETAYEYDAYGNVAKTVATESYNNDKRIGYNWYNYDTVNWNLRQLKENIVVGYDKDRVFKVQDGTYNTYDSKGNLEIIHKWTEQTSTYSVGSDGSITRPSGSDSRWVRRQKFYYDDEYGNVNQVKDARGNSTYTTYDTKYGVFPVKTVNALNHTTWNCYDYYGSEYDEYTISDQIALGRLTKTVFQNTNFYSSQYYDVFGRVTKKVRMDYSQNYPTEKIDYTDAVINRADGSIITPASVKVTKRPLPGPEGADNQLLETYTYTDGLGRTIQTKTKYADSLYTTVDTWYQISGNQTKTITSEPYLTSTSGYTGRDTSQPQTVTASWMDESEGSKSTITGTDGSVITITNKLWVTTVTDAKGNIRKSWCNGFGQTLEILEPIGTKTKYTYETGSGNLVQVRDAYGNLTTLQYNTLGQKVREIDPDLGTTSYTYDQNGNLLTQTNAKRQTITYEYDELNRLTLTTYPGVGNMDVFIYDTDTPENEYGVGKLGQTYVYRNYERQEEQAFSYDQYGNVVHKYHWLDVGKVSGIDYQYDGLGRMISATYPDAEQYTYQYKLNGYGLDSITRSSDGQVILDSVNYLPTGKIAKMHFGNGIGINYEYWAANQVGADMLKRLYTTGAADQLDLDYSYDRNGNVLTINDAITPHFNQSFVYDELNRLTEMNMGSLQTYAYDGIGNMISKEGKTLSYGHFSGKGNKPHAVKNDGSYIYQYDAAGNLVEKRAIGSLAENIIQIPVNVLNYDIYGLDKVALNDRVELKTADGGYGPVGSPKEIELGQSAKAGTVTAEDKIYLRDYSEVYGDVVTRPGKLTQQNNVYIGGSFNEVMGMDDMLPGVTANNIDFTGTPHTDTYVNSGQTATIAPGKYWNYTVRNNGGLNLTSGVYYFNTLQMEGNSRLNLDETGGPVKIYVQQTLQMRAGTYHSKAGGEGTASLLIGYVGTQDVYLGGATRFDGTVIAPKAKLIAGQEQNKVFEGMFIGKEVHFHQNSKVTYVPFKELVPDIYYYKYDWNDKLVEVQRGYQTVMTSKYGVDGSRIKKSEAGTDSYYFFVEYEEDWNGNTLADSAKYYFANGKRIAKENATGELSFYVGDHLGSNTKVINEAKETVMTMRYMPYGGMAFENGTQNEDYRFNGKELDAIGLYYYGARFYDPNLGRFISADTVTPGNGGDPQGLNRYSYCNNNPVKYIDPSGHVGVRWSDVHGTGGAGPRALSYYANGSYSAGSFSSAANTYYSGLQGDFWLGSNSLGDLQIKYGMNKIRGNVEGNGMDFGGEYSKSFGISLGDSNQLFLSGSAGFDRSLTHAMSDYGPMNSRASTTQAEAGVGITHCGVANNNSLMYEMAVQALGNFTYKLAYGENIFSYGTGLTASATGYRNGAHINNISAGAGIGLNWNRAGSGSPLSLLTLNLTSGVGFQNGLSMKGGYSHYIHEARDLGSPVNFKYGQINFDASFKPNHFIFSLGGAFNIYGDVPGAYSKPWSINAGAGYEF